MKLLQLFQMILGLGEEIVPIFVHNPNSQKIEGIVVTTANAAIAALQTAVVKPVATK